MIIMGKSVFFLPMWKRGAQNRHMHNLWEQLGPGRLKLEGPFSGNGPAFAQIVEHVRETAPSDSKNDRMETVIRTLLPQDRLPEGYPFPSTLEVPFILDEIPQPGWRKRYPENAGEVASIAPVRFNEGMARPAESSEITMLAVSVLRALGMECYFSVCTCLQLPLGTIPGSGPAVMISPLAIPVIIMPNGQSPNILSLIPEPTRFFLQCPPMSFEVLDADALLSFSMVYGAYRHARSLMLDIAAHRPMSDEECALRSRQVGHILHKAMWLWTLYEAQRDERNATKIFGTSSGLVSVRETLQTDIVHTLTSPQHHARLAAGMMRIQDPATPSFTFYMELASVMNSHVHDASECGESQGGEAGEISGPGRRAAPGKVFH
jgi:hypothetical protein